MIKVENGTSAEIKFKTKEDAMDTMAEYKEKAIDQEELNLELIEPKGRPSKEIYRPPSKSLSSTSTKKSYGNRDNSRGGRGGRRNEIDPRDIKISVRL